MPDTPTASTTRRDAIRALGLGALGLPLAACGTSERAGVPARIVESPRIPQTRDALPAGTLPDVATTVPLDSVATAAPARALVLPRRLRAGATVGLVAPAGVLRSTAQVDDAVADMRALGFETRVGRHALARYGFLAGTDRERADDLMAMVADPDVDAILCLRGGYGCARILPLLDYDAIREAAKPIIGYSDVTALLLAVYARAGLVSFHGPVGISTWAGTTARSFTDVLVRGATLAVESLPRTRSGAETREARVEHTVVRRGSAEGPLVGGNLSVVASLAGTGFLPSFSGAVAFFEEVEEESYRIDRLLTQLEMAGVLRDPAAVVFGQCARCSSGGSSWSAEEVLRDHLRSYRCPSWLGAPIGHVSPVYTLPIGLPVRTDADAGTLDATGPAVA